MTESSVDNSTLRNVSESEALIWTGRSSGTTDKRYAMALRGGSIALVVVLVVIFTPIQHAPASTTGLNLVAHAAAQGAADATPEGDEAVCTTPPRPFAEFAAMADEPAGGLRSFQLGTPSAEIATPAPPTGGTPAGPDVVNAVTVALHDMYACLNSGDLLRASALWTDDFLRLGLGGLDVEFIAMMATPSAVPAADRLTIIAVEDVRTLADGRVTAIVRSEDERALHVFVVEADGRYLVDGIFELPVDGTPGP